MSDKSDKVGKTRDQQSREEKSASRVRSGADDTQDNNQGSNQDAGQPSAQETRSGKYCPDHPDIEMADTDEGVGICNYPDCRYSAEALAENRHPVQVERREREQEDEARSSR